MTVKELIDRLNELNCPDYEVELSGGAELNLHNVNPIGLYLWGVLVAKIPNFLEFLSPGYLGGITLLPAKFWFKWKT